MEHPNLDILERFDEKTLPDLDVCVLGALELFADQGLPPLEIATSYRHPLIVGSVGAAVTGRILFGERNVVFANESTYQKKLQDATDIDGVVLVSASGGKHSIPIAQELQKRGVPMQLLTNNPDAPAKTYVGDANTFVFPKNREPYTYNTSTYLGMILSKTKESPTAIYKFITEQVAARVTDNLDRYDAFFFILPPRFDAIQQMLSMKFDELFGPRVSGRIFTKEQAKHSKTVIPSDTECFVSFGEENDLFGREENRLYVPLPERCDYGNLMAIGYYFIGQIQKQHPPYFKENLISYTKQASVMFRHPISPIVG